MASKTTKAPRTARLNDVQKQVLLAYYLLWAQAKERSQSARPWRRKRAQRLEREAHGVLNDMLLLIAGAPGAQLVVQADGKGGFTPVVTRP